MSRLQKMLWAAKRPIAVIGGSRWSEAACAAMMRFAERFALPVATTFRAQHLFDALHPCYAGDFGIGPNPKLLARVKGADLVLLIGDRMSEMSSQSYTAFDIPEPQMKLVHVHPGSEELGRVYHPALAINATPSAFCASLEGLQPPNEIAWKGESDTAHADFMAWTEKATAVPGGVNLGEIMVWLRENLPAGFLHHQRRRQFRNLDQPLLSLPQIRHAGRRRLRARWVTDFRPQFAMKTLHPDRIVVNVAGDGDFLMTGQDFATAVQYKLPVIVVLSDNGLYGTIRMHQERDYPGRVVATELKNPDFVAYAKAFGGFGVLVEKTADFPAAFAAAQKSGLPSIIHLKVDPEAITPAMSLTAIREKSLAGGGEQERDALGLRRAHSLPSLRRRGPAEAFAKYWGHALSRTETSCFFPLNHHSLIPCPIAAPRLSSGGLPRASKSILEAATAIAAEGGMAAVHIAAVAERAGIAAGTVYRYFPSKTDLIAELVAAVAGRELDAMQAAGDAAPGPLSALAASIASFAARALR